MLPSGGTAIGWLGSLVWAFQAVHRSEGGSHGGESGINLFANDAVIVREEPRSLQPADNDPAEKLQRLTHLFDGGSLSAEEYAAMRRPIVNPLMD
ncbi:hypothetical protein [uncultured Devosia sp.]|uniref:hypothetical protein n=1 Tax=uncultured Devosia sp. TaxID=211434 RepID=UPI0035CAF833